MEPLPTMDVLRHVKHDSMLNIMFYNAIYNGLLSEARVLRTFIIYVDVLDMKNFNMLTDSEFKDIDEVQKFFFKQSSGAPHGDENEQIKYSDAVISELLPRYVQIEKSIDNKDIEATIGHAVIITHDVLDSFGL